MDKLLPCPFCGGEAEAIYAYFDYNMWHIACKDCGANVCHGEGKEQTITLWNRRPEPENKPLTDAELRTKRNKPVWIHRLSGEQADSWEIVGRTVPCPPEGEDWRYGETWLAYDRPPREGR